MSISFIFCYLELRHKTTPAVKEELINGALLQVRMAKTPLDSQKRSFYYCGGEAIWDALSDSLSRLWIP